jgi:ATP-dependent phosphofructokinase / diphosphate-dependent phosphofructokinase
MSQDNHGTVALLFSGGPAPAANSVISAAALSFLDHGFGVLGILEGFTHLQGFKPESPLQEGKHFLSLTSHTASGIRNQRGIFIRSARANPGKDVKAPADLQDGARTAKLTTSVAALRSLGVTALVTMGGDDTLKTANFMNHFGMPTIHVPKTIDNDYYGIPWTFGYWTAVDTARKVLLNLKADADSTNAYFLVELMGRSAGWMAYASAVAGEACAVVAAEDLDGDLNPDELASRFADLIIARDADGRRAGIICIAEGLAERLDDAHKPKEIDAHGNVYYGRAELCRTLAEKAMALYKERTGRDKKINPKQVGYETRCAEPCAFDVVLGSMLGHGAWRLLSEGRFGHMVSVDESLNIKAIPFSDLIDPATLKTKIRLVPREGDIFKLKEALSFPVKR